MQSNQELANYLKLTFITKLRAAMKPLEQCKPLTTDTDSTELLTLKTITTVCHPRQTQTPVTPLLLITFMFLRMNY